MDTFSEKNSHDNKFGELKSSLLKYYEGQESEILSLQNQLELLTTENRKLREDSESVAELQNEVLEAVQDSFRKEVELQKSQNIIDDLQINLKTLKFNFDESKTLLENNTQISEKQIQKLLSAGQNLEEKVMHLTVSLMEAEGREIRLLESASKNQDRTRLRESELADLEQIVQKWQAEAQQLKGQIQILQNELSSQKELSKNTLMHKQKAESQINDLWQKITNQNQFILELSQEKEAKQKRLEHSEQTVKKLNEDLSQLTILKKEIVNLKEAALRFESTIATQKGELQHRQESFRIAESRFRTEVTEIQNRLTQSEMLLRQQSEKHSDDLLNLKTDLSESFSNQLAAEQEIRENLIQNYEAKILEGQKKHSELLLVLDERVERERQDLSKEFDQKIKEEREHRAQMAQAFNQKLTEKQKYQEKLKENFNTRFGQEQKQREELSRSFQEQLKEEQIKHSHIAHALHEQIKQEKAAQDVLSHNFDMRLEDEQKKQVQVSQAFKARLAEERKCQDELVRNFNAKLAQERLNQEKIEEACQIKITDEQKKHDELVQAFNLNLSEERNKQENLQIEFSAKIAEEQKKQDEIIQKFNEQINEIRADSSAKEQALLKKVEDERATQARLIEEQKKLEKQTSQYMKFISQEKSKAQMIIGQLAQEIHQAITLHPLRDYLLATEKEISKVECELKKTPTISEHRLQFETMIGQLIAQRDYIKDLIAKTEKHLNSYNGTLERVTKSGFLALSPPPPGT